MEQPLNGTNGAHAKGRRQTKLLLFATPADAEKRIPPPKRPVRGIFVTGTDTGVGKTAVACALVATARTNGWKVAAYKPLETGVKPPARFGADAGCLAKACGVPPGFVAGMVFPDALAPAAAADLARMRISVAPLKRRYERLRLENDLVLIEGAGGVLVPITWETSFLDLAEDWGLAALVVARSGLGTLNHTVLTVRALKDRGIDVAAVVMNRRHSRADAAERTNPESLSHLLPGLPIFVLPEVKGKDAYAVGETLAARLAPHLQRLFRACAAKVRA